MKVTVIHTVLAVQRGFDFLPAQLLQFNLSTHFCIPELQTPHTISYALARDSHLPKVRISAAIIKQILQNMKKL